MADVKWTILLYLSGDNNLSPDMVRTINDIAAAGIPEDVALAIQFDPSSPALPTLRYIIPPKNRLSTKLNVDGSVPLPSRAVPVKRAENAASPAVLKDFIVESLTELKKSGVIGRRRLLVLSGHGSGAIGDFLTDDHVPKRQLHSLSIPFLGEALSNAKRELADPETVEFAKEVPLFHVLGMDSCLMNMAEVCDEVRYSRLKGETDVSNRLVNCLVGSEGFVPRAGWPYGFLFQQIQKRTPVTSEEMSRCIVRDYVDFYRNYLAADVSVDIAACELRKLDGVVKALCGLTSLLGEHLDDRAIQDLVILSHWKAQSFKFEQYTDLWDFCDRLREAAEDSFKRFHDHNNALRDASLTLSIEHQKLLDKSVDLVSKCAHKLDALTKISARAQEVCQAIEDVTRRDEKDRDQSTQGSAGVEFQHAHGVSVYFPWQLPATPKELSDHAGTQFADLNQYKKLRFAENSGWGAFLEKYLGATMRPPRKTPNGKTIATLIAGIARQLGTPLRKIAGDDNRIAGDDNRIAGDDNRFLIQMFGGRMPWSMKNPPQQVEIEVPAEAHTGAGQESGA